MKYLVAAVFAVVVAYVISERCHHINECKLTFCSGNTSHVECQHDTCTCAQHIKSCMAKSECMELGQCHDHEEHYHCFDGYCACTKDPTQSHR